MLDPITLDQMRILVAAMHEGSFSAAGRRLGRAQSVISQSIAGLEGQLGIQLFERNGRFPKLTEPGRALATEARAVLRQADRFKARARDLATGIEPELALAIDVMFPIDIFTAAIAEFEAAFPDTLLRVYVESLGAVIQPVLDRRCPLAIAGAVPLFPVELVQEWLLSMPMTMVASPDHPLAKIGRRLSRDDLSGHVQLVLSDRSLLSEGKDFGVLAQRTWRLADLGAKHAFLRAGLGWGGMPLPMVETDLATGQLVELNVDDSGWLGGRLIPMIAVHRHDAPPGPAGRWLIERLKSLVS